ncbi:Tol-Pal system protein TolB [Helicobacter burdigaliensis]|uniref:Tol-Pal system protein TolB n=1 Tax=Helicobacter burdigaliensis TaxID=2315334 RepID=UPI000EF6E3D9|nr:Tol-Pal system protein TolB [Helicobacter burdigaliensis]
MKKLFVVVWMCVGVLFAKVDATLEVVKQVGNAPTILIQTIEGGGELAPKISRMLMADLKITGHFKAQEAQNAVLEEEVINFDALRAEGVNLVFRIKVWQTQENLVVKALLYDVNLSRLVLDKEYSTKEIASYPMIVHRIAIEANDYIKAPKVDWLNRKVVLAYYTKSGESKIIQADYTLSFVETLVEGGLNIFPKWANKEQSAIYYTKYLDKPTLFKYDLKTGQTTQMFNSNGMLVVSDVSKDSSKLLVTMAPKDQADVFLYDVAKNSFQQITKYRGIDVSGNFIDEEQRIMFISDRLGYPNIFGVSIMGESMGAVEQMVYHGRNNNAANAYGEYIVYSSRESSEEFGRNTFNLYLVSSKSDFIRRLTANGVNQLPRFSSDGETIMYLKHQENQSALGIIRLNYNKTFLFPLKEGVIQSMDW